MRLLVMVTCRGDSAGVVEERVAERGAAGGRRGDLGLGVVRVAAADDGRDGADGWRRDGAADGAWF